MHLCLYVRMRVCTVFQGADYELQGFPLLDCRHYVSNLYGE